jgi:hypothetical protein
MRKRAALAAEPSGAHGNHPDGNVYLRRASPDQRNKPTDNGPAEKQVHNENADGIDVVPPNNGGKEIQERRENQEGHVFTPLCSGVIPNRVPRSPLMPDTLELAGLFPSRYLALLELAVNFRLLLFNFM